MSIKSTLKEIVRMFKIAFGRENEDIAGYPDWDVQKKRIEQRRKYQLSAQRFIARSTYRIDYDEGAKPFSITCLTCNRTSYSLHDISEKFCAVCGFHDTESMSLLQLQSILDLARKKFPDDPDSCSRYLLDVEYRAADVTDMYYRAHYRYDSFLKVMHCIIYLKDHWPGFKFDHYRLP